MRQRIFREDGILFVDRYVNMSNVKTSHISLGYNFKRYFRNSRIISGILETLKDRLGLDTCIGIPGHHLGLNNCQKLADSDVIIYRKEMRPKKHLNDYKISIEKEKRTIQIVKNRDVKSALLFDDVLNIGETVFVYRRILKSIGIEKVVPFVLSKTERAKSFVIDIEDLKLEKTGFESFEGL
jgi:adenine/guanine phosphoribosyltransferase-like PRPP-binding protein